MKALVLAAGYATRMAEQTAQNPKQLLEILPGIPVIELVVRNICSAKEIDEIYIMTNDRFYTKFAEWLAKTKFQKRVLLINNKTRNNEERNGSVGDLLLGINTIKEIKNLEEGVLIGQGDDLTHGLDFNRLLDEYKTNNSATIVVHRAQAAKIAKRFGVVEVDMTNKVTEIKEKPKLEEIAAREDRTALACGGYFVLKPENLELLEEYKREKLIEMTSYGKRLIMDRMGLFLSWIVKRETPVHVYEHPKERWWDVETATDLEEARSFYRSTKPHPKQETHQQPYLS